MCSVANSARRVIILSINYGCKLVYRHMYVFHFNCARRTRYPTPRLIRDACITRNEKESYVENLKKMNVFL